MSSLVSKVKRTTRSQQHAIYLSDSWRMWNMQDKSVFLRQPILQDLPHNLFTTAWIKPPGGREQRWSWPITYSFLLSGPMLSTCEGIETWRVLSSQNVGLAAWQRFLEEAGFILAAHENLSDPSSLSSETGIFWTGVRGNSLVAIWWSFFFWFWLSPSVDDGQKESKRLLRCKKRSSYNSIVTSTNLYNGFVVRNDQLIAYNSTVFL